MNPRGLNRLGEGHRRQDGGESLGRHGRDRSRGTQVEMMIDTTSAYLYFRRHA
jgi:hypothetical protein